MTLLSLPPTLRAFLAAWACGSWIKASLLIHHRPNVFKQRLHEEERRSIAFYYLMLTYVTLRLNTSSPLKSPIRLPTLFFLTLLSSIFDESIQLACLRRYHQIRHSTSLIGAPPPADQTSSDCCICLGTLTLEPDDNEDDLKLESFCRVPHHVAHRRCMHDWWISSPESLTRGLGNLTEGDFSVGQIILSPRPDVVWVAGASSSACKPAERTCPSCRQPIAVSIVAKSNKREVPLKELMRNGEGAAAWRELNRFVEWRDVGFRWAVVASFASVMWGVESVRRASGKWSGSRLI